MKDFYDSKANYRGDIVDINKLNEKDGYHYFSISTETAWMPMIKMWHLMLKKLYPGKDIHLAYQAEEPGLDIFMKYDEEGIFYDEDYYIELYIENLETVQQKYPHIKFNEDPDHYCTEKYAIKYLQELLNTKENNMDVLFKMAEQFNKELQTLDEDSYLSVHCYACYADEDS